jgi:hypothetical protein
MTCIKAAINLTMAPPVRWSMWVFRTAEHPMMIGADHVCPLPAEALKPLLEPALGFISRNPTR